MALRDFWISVQAGAGLLSPRATSDSPRIDPSEMERTLRNAVMWLTPSSVSGFDENDFPFLPEAERSELSACVAEFRRVARQVPPTGPAAPEQIEQALPPFLRIVELLEFDRFGNAEAFRIGKQVERRIEPIRPPELEELRFDARSDHAGDPGLWIWVHLADDDDEPPLARGGAALGPGPGGPRGRARSLPVPAFPNRGRAGRATPANRGG